ncbi:MAG: hypothetical protein QW733_02045 [Desulfurococcaceae archaeon]
MSTLKPSKSPVEEFASRVQKDLEEFRKKMEKLMSEIDKAIKQQASTA